MEGRRTAWRLSYFTYQLRWNRGNLFLFTLMQPKQCVLLPSPSEQCKDHMTLGCLELGNRFPLCVGSIACVSERNAISHYLMSTLEVRRLCQMNHYAGVNS